jgi:hypothetical protein
MYNTAPPVAKATQELAPRPMDRVAAAAGLIDGINMRLESVLARFNGTPPAERGEEPLYVSYINAIDRLHANIGLLDKLSNELAEIA